MVGLCLGGRLQKFHAHRRRREVMIAVELDRPIAFRHDLTMPQGFHAALLFRRPAPGTPPLAVGVPAFRARFAHGLHLAAVPPTWSRETLRLGGDVFALCTPRSRPAAAEKTSGQ